MEKIKLSAKKREIIGKKVNQLRKIGQIPVSLYGQGGKTDCLSVILSDFIKAYKKAGQSALIDLEIDDKNPVKILVKDLQKHPVTDQILHADFYKIKMDVEIKANIPLAFIGEAPAVKELEGNLITNKDEVEVECLPGDLIHEIQVDVSGLKTFDDAILIKDLVVPENVKIIDDPEETVAVVTPPRSEEELEAMETEAAADSEKAQIEKIEADAEAEKSEKPAESEGEEKVEKVTEPDKTKK